MNLHLIETLGDELFNALQGRRSLPPLTHRHPDIQLEDAYRISLRFLQRREQLGERVIGKKIGVTSEAVQIHGGAGLIKGHPVEWLFRASRMMRILTGTSEIQRHIISRSLLRPLGS